MTEDREPSESVWELLDGSLTPGAYTIGIVVRYGPGPGDVVMHTPPDTEIEYEPVEWGLTNELDADE